MSRFNVMPRATEITQEKIAKAYHVPYWIISSKPKPSWLKRPIWRTRALWWRYFG